MCQDTCKIINNKRFEIEIHEVILHMLTVLYCPGETRSKCIAPEFLGPSIYIYARTHQITKVTK